MRAASSGIFLLYRTLGDGIRLHAAALVLAVAAGVPHYEWIVIVVLGLAMILYTEEGGVTATIWTDTVQMFVYLAGALVCLVAVIRLLPMSVGEVMTSAAAAGKLNVLNLSWDMTQPFTLLAGVVGGMFLTLSTHGTDHYLVQRLLVARSRRDAAIGLTLSGFLVMAQFVLFLFLGTLLWAHFGGRAFAREDEVLPTFIAAALPGGRTGFILAAIVAAALSPSLNSMASATVRDFYVPYVRPGRRRRAADARRPPVHGGVGRSRSASRCSRRTSTPRCRAAWPRSATRRGRPSARSCSACCRSRARHGRHRSSAWAWGSWCRSPPGAAPFLFGVPGVAWTWNVAVGAVVTVVVGEIVSRLTGTRRASSSALIRFRVETGKRGAPRPSCPASETHRSSGNTWTLNDRVRTASTPKSRVAPSTPSRRRSAWIARLCFRGRSQRLLTWPSKSEKGFFADHDVEAGLGAGRLAEGSGIVPGIPRGGRARA